MARGFFGAFGAGSDKGGGGTGGGAGDGAGGGAGDGAGHTAHLDESSWRAIVAACLVAAGAVCLGGAVGVVTIGSGASSGLGLSVTIAIWVAGAVGAFLIVRRSGRRAVDQAPQVLLEQQLSARYGVPVQRVAWHVWRINGELIEATLEPTTGQLITGGRELSL